MRIETRGSVGSGAASSVIDAGRTNATAYPPSCVLCCKTGAVIATYEPGGEIEHGWAGPQSTSEREVARQAAMAGGDW